MKILNTPGSIDARDTMYPSILNLCQDTQFDAIPYSTVFGFVLEGTVTYKNYSLIKNQWFSCKIVEGETFQISGKAVLISRLGYLGQDTTGGPIESIGRLTYIDGCSDSLLVYPPRMGDASLNALYFPKSINQTHHIHPSIRMGIIASGSGICSLDNEEIELTEGTAFCLSAMENHRFRTIDDTMVVIAYHPDGDWGPTDHTHTMINRTYIS
jgi:mannose-6-phosphate isomerase-like protein (cupin superfamily)